MSKEDENGVFCNGLSYLLRSVDLGEEDTKGTALWSLTAYLKMSHSWLSR